MPGGQLGWENLFTEGTPYYNGLAPNLFIHPNVLNPAQGQQPQMADALTPPLASATNRVQVQPSAEDERERVRLTRNSADAYAGVFQQQAGKPVKGKDGSEMTSYPWPKKILIEPGAEGSGGEFATKDSTIKLYGMGQPVVSPNGGVSFAENFVPGQYLSSGYWPVTAYKNYNYDPIMAHELGHFVDFDINKGGAQPVINPYVAAFGLGRLANNPHEIDRQTLPPNARFSEFKDNFEPWADQFARGLDLLASGVVPQTSEGQQERTALQFAQPARRTGASIGYFLDREEVPKRMPDNWVEYLKAARPWPGQLNTSNINVLQDLLAELASSSMQQRQPAMHPLLFDPAQALQVKADKSPLQK